MKKGRLAAALAGSALLLTGCASGDSNSSWGQYYQVLKQSFSGSFSGHQITREQAAAIPYASLGYRLNDGAESLVVLATDTNGEELWTSNAHIVIMTENGRIKHTVGLPHDLGQLAPSRGPSLPAPAQALQGPYTALLTADFPSTGSYSVALTCRLAVATAEAITILGHSIATTRVDENCESPQLKWHFRNSYWIDADKFVWRALQHINPKGDTLEFEVLRPPG